MADIRDITYIAEAGQTDFAVPFTVYDVDDIVVVRDGNTVSFAFDDVNEKIALSVAAQADETVRIFSVNPGDRHATFTPQIPLTALALNTEFDKAYATMAELRRDISFIGGTAGQAGLLPQDIGDSLLFGNADGTAFEAVNFAPAVARAGKIIGFDSTGNIKALSLTSSVAAIDFEKITAALAAKADLALYNGLAKQAVVDGQIWETNGTGGHAANEADGIFTVLDAAGRLWELKSPIPHAANRDMVKSGFKSGQPVSADIVELIIDLSEVAPYANTPEGRFAYFDAAINYLQRCTARVRRLGIKRGFHSLKGHRTEKYNSIEIFAVNDAEAEVGGQLHKIASVSFGPVISGFSLTTVVVESALPDHVAAGFPLGFENLAMDNDGNYLGGMGKVETIAADRLSFTTKVWAGAKTALTNPTNIPGAAILGTVNRLSNYIICPQVGLSLDAEGWGDGTAQEGFIDVRSNVTVSINGIGLAYDGQGGTEHDMLFAEQSGIIKLQARSVIVGAGDKLVRLAGKGKCYIDQSCLAGAGLADECIALQQGSKVTLRNLSLGGATKYCIAALETSTGSATAMSIVNANEGIRIQGVGAAFETGNSKIAHCTRGVMAINGEISFQSGGVTIDRCATGLDGIDGIIIGNVTLTNNTVPSRYTPDMTMGNGGWQRTTGKPLTRRNALPLIAPGSVRVVPLTGRGGMISVIPNSNITGFAAQIIANVAPSVLNSGYMLSAGPDANYIANTVLTGSSGAAGKVNYSIANNSLYIENRLSSGNLDLSTLFSGEINAA